MGRDHKSQRLYLVDRERLSVKTFVFVRERIMAPRDIREQSADKREAS